MSTQVPAFDRSALYTKSQLFIGRALRAKSENDLALYGLWCSLSIELLGKSTLANLSPALVADPTHRDSLFAACGKTIGTDFKSITAKTVFERLPYITKRFDAYTTRFCEQLAYRRNAELHSGEASLSGMRLDVWERQFWHAAEVMLAAQDQTLSGWLGADAATAPTDLLKHAEEAIRQSVEARIEAHQQHFTSKYKSDKQRTTAIEDSSILRLFDYLPEYPFRPDTLTRSVCPSCKSVAVLAASLWEETILDEYNPDEPNWESVEKTFLVEGLFCPTCSLKLGSRQEVVAAGFDEEFKETEEREREYEPDYGND